MGIWQLGNTSVRSALRIRDGLVAYSQSSIQGDIRGAEGDIRFRNLLGECGIVSLGEDETKSVGRKWRSAMEKLGFLYPEVQKNMGFSQKDLGPLDAITPAGWNLIKAETVPTIQECFLRAMVSPMEVCSPGQSFSPLCWTLALLLELEKHKTEPSVTFIEMAIYVQTSAPNELAEHVISELLDFRKRRNQADSKRLFDKNIYAEAARRTGNQASTFRDYADMNIRYLKATGMVQACGKGISLVPEKHALAIALTKNLFSKEPLLNRYKILCKGADLPTDNASVARQVLDDLLTQAKQFNISCSFNVCRLNTSAEINQARYEIEDLIAGKKEEEYACNQAAQWKEIADYMDLIASRKTYAKHGDTEISVPKAEAPAYLEWTLWRAFLAIDSMVNNPSTARRFKIDQDFMPVGTAPGNGPDLIAEFADYVIVVEVTLSESSRQEAMEGEPVRRHVADLMQQYNKPVYGLFIANRIDSNTAETFRIGVWYTNEDIKLNLQIIPFTLKQFSSLFKSIFASGKAEPQTIVNLMLKCASFRDDCEAPLWKQRIEDTVTKYTDGINKR